MQSRVDFFIAGVQKGGTTALDQFLREHPSIQMASNKEAHHFDDESVNWNSPEHSRLHGLFDWTKPDVLRGEATPIYSYWPQAIERLRDYNPNAKIIIGLRHPSFRAFSHWRMEKKRSAETLTFTDAIEVAARRRVREAPGGAHRVFSYVERGFYFEQITRILRCFPRQQVHFFRTDHLWLQQMSVLNGIFDFLGVAHGHLLPRRYTVPIDASELGEIPSVARNRLDRLFEADIHLTSRETGIELADWLKETYREPMAPT